MLFLLMACPLFSFGQTFTITASDPHHLSIHFELNDFSIDTVRCNGELMHTIATKGIVCPNEYGLPNLPTFNRFIAIPQGAKATVEVSARGNERMTGINIAPSIGAQFENDAERSYQKDMRCYSTDAFYPVTSYVVAEPQQLRGVDVIHLGLSPFQFNPVTRELIVNHELDIEIRFEGGNGHFGDDRLRSPYWDPILQNTILNYDCLAPIDYDARRQEWTRNRDTGCEYLILTPNNQVFINAAQELADYRTRQGILTDVMSLAETGSYNPDRLKRWIRDIYHSWDIPPAAVCIIGDQGNDLTQFVPAVPTYSPKDGTISSDNPYADVNDDYLPDICFSRLVAENASELPILIGKQMEYEYTNPCMNPYYYEHPVTATAWQDSKWFQITSASIYGYLEQHDKSPILLSAVYAGPLNDNWSNASGTGAVVSYFGPNGLGYIPANPLTIGPWTGAGAEDVIQAFNQGAYIVQHRDHGWDNKWYEPEIYTYHFDAINNPGQMPFLISVNCRTGAFSSPNLSFIEALLRMTRNGQNAGIVGAIGPSGQTYSFANDIFTWGIWDLFDPEFLPDHGPYASHVAEWMPAFANVSGKYFLDEQVFPSTDESMRTLTYNVFHAHCDAFLRLFTEVPQPIEASFDASVTCFFPFHITVPEGVQIALSANYDDKVHLLATATGTGEEQALYVMDHTPADSIQLTLTGKNYLRHEVTLPLHPFDGPIVVADSVFFKDGATHLHYGESTSMDLKVHNVGLATNVTGMATLADTTGQMQITLAQTSIPTLMPDESLWIEDAFQFTLSDSLPDGSRVPFSVTTESTGGSVEREFKVDVVAPNLTAALVAINDQSGNGNGHLDTGEFASLTFRLTNIGHYEAERVCVTLANHEGYVRVITPETTIENLAVGATADVTFDVYVEHLAGEVPSVAFLLNATYGGLVMEESFHCPVNLSFDSFETGVLNPEYWINDPEHPWHITDVGAFEGSYCVQSDTTLDISESSQLVLNCTSNAEGRFSFYVKVSSLYYNDVLTFYMDGHYMYFWSGESDWMEYECNIGPGEHNFVWVYSKNLYPPDGDDCAWLDYITLPPNLDKTTEHPELPLTLHPNPTTGQINIDIEQEGHFTVQVFDEKGRLIMAEQDVPVISIKDKPAGMYHIVVTQDGQRWSRRIIKM